MDSIIIITILIWIGSLVLKMLRKRRSTQKPAGQNSSPTSPGTTQKGNTQNSSNLNWKELWNVFVESLLEDEDGDDNIFNELKGKKRSKNKKKEDNPKDLREVAVDLERSLSEDAEHAKAITDKGKPAVSGKYAPITSVIEPAVDEGQSMTAEGQKGLKGYSAYKSPIDRPYSIEYQVPTPKKKRTDFKSTPKNVHSKRNQSLAEGMKALYSGDVDEAKKAVIYSEIFNPKF